MEPVVGGHLGVKRRAKQISLSDRNDGAIGQRREGLGFIANPFDDWCPDEDCSHRRITDLRNVEIHLERCGLGSKRIATDRNVQATDALLIGDAIDDFVGEHNQAGAGPVYRQPVRNGSSERFCHPEYAGQLVNNTRFTARNDQSGDRRELLGPTHWACVGAEGRQHLEVLTEIALKCKHSNGSSVCRVTSHARQGGEVPPGRKR
jgi:hypothetical protein